MMTVPLVFTLLVASLCLPPQSPVIGIYTQDVGGTTPSNNTYIASSYVKYIQMAGAQVVPIFYKSTQADLKLLLSQINGVVFPGGGMELNISNEFTKNADYILKYSMEQNDLGKPFPVWGICLGHQLLSYLTSGYDSQVIQRVTGQSPATNTVQFLTKDSPVLANWTKHQFDAVSTGKGILYYHHNWAVYQTYFKKSSHMNSFWRLLATSTSSANQTFVAFMQANKYPFWSVQFHAQKNLFQWKTDAPRLTLDSIEVPQRLAQAFVQKAKQSPNRFTTNQSLFKHLIYNYRAVPPPPGFDVQSFQQVYLFQEK